MKLRLVVSVLALLGTFAIAAPPASEANGLALRIE